jgi:FCP1-like phosphatase family protein
VLSLQHQDQTSHGNGCEYVKAAFLAHDPMLEVKKSFAERMEKEAISDLVKERKGILILDLDHTLFQVTLRPISAEVPGFETWKFDTEIEHSGKLLEGKTYWFNLDSPQSSAPFFIHLRPGMYSFLKTAASMFELYAYTQGTQEYAKKILSAIDPKGDFFGNPSRLIAREIDPATGMAGRKNLSRVFPNEESLVLIIDDRDDVWDSNASFLNLIKLSPFLFFQDKEREKLFGLSPSSDPLFHPMPGNAKLSLLVTDLQLRYLETLLGDLHAQVFFSGSPLENGSFQSVLTARKSSLFENFLFMKNDRLHSNVYRLVKQYGGKVIEEEISSKQTIVYLGIPGQSRKGHEPDLIHPWFVMFCISTLTVPQDVELFSISRIEQEGIENVWDVIPTEEPLGEDDLLGDLLESN